MAGLIAKGQITIYDTTDGIPLQAFIIATPGPQQVLLGDGETRVPDWRTANDNKGIIFKAYVFKGSTTTTLDITADLQNPRFSFDLLNDITGVNQLVSSNAILNPFFESSDGETYSAVHNQDGSELKIKSNLRSNATLKMLYFEGDYVDENGVTIHIVAQIGFGLVKYGEPARQYYILPLNGAAIRNSSTDLLTLEARYINGNNDSLLTDGTVKLYVGNSEVTEANGYQPGSNGYTGIFNASNINNSVVVSLKDGPDGVVHDTFTLVDITDGEPGDPAVYGFIEPSAPLTWVRDVDGTTWTPAGTSVDLHVSFVQGGAKVARIARRATRDSEGLITITPITHKNGDLDIGRISDVTVYGVGTRTVTIQFTYSFNGAEAIITENINSNVSGLTGPSGKAVAELLIFRRYDVAPVVAPTGGFFDFESNYLEPPAGWSTDIPGGSDPVYVSIGLAAVEGGVGIAIPNWSVPTLAFTDGEPGSAVDIIFRRYAMPGPPKPSPSSGLPAGWYTNVENVPLTSDPLWSSVGTRPNPTTDWTWQDPILVEGLPGEQGPPGDNAVVYEVISSSPVIFKNSPGQGIDGVHTNITVSGKRYIGNTSSSFGFVTLTANGDVEAGVAVASFTSNIANNANKAMYVARLYDTSNKTTLLDSDEIPVVFTGADSHTVALSNDSHTVPSDFDGSNPIFTGSGTTIYVYESGTKLTYNATSAVFPTTNGTYNVEKINGTGVSSGSITLSGSNALFAGLTGMTNDTGEVTFNVRIKGRTGQEVLITKIQTFSKSKQGPQGQTGQPGPDGNVRNYIFIRSLTQPATPTGNGTPSGWSSTPPTGTAPLWFSVALQTTDGTTIGSWSTPVKMDGNRWYSGAGAPAGSLGLIGDWYLNETNGDVYEKTGVSTWTLRDNFQGPPGENGADAEYYFINESSPVIYKNAPDAATDGVHTSITVSGKKVVGTATLDHGFVTLTGNGQTEAGTAQASITLTPANNAGRTSYTARLYDTSGKVGLRDTEIIPVVFQGGTGAQGPGGIQGLTLNLSNDSHNLRVNTSGTVTYTGSGTSIYVIEGTTYYSYVSSISGNNQFTVSAVASPANINIGGGTAISAGSSPNRAIVANHSNMTADTVLVTYTITARNSSGVTQTGYLIQSLSKVYDGTPGGNGAPGTSVTMVYRKSATAPGTPTSTTNPPSSPQQWYASIALVPASTDPLWSSVGTSPDGTTWTWQIPVRMEGVLTPIQLSDFASTIDPVVPIANIHSPLTAPRYLSATGVLETTNTSTNRLIKFLFDIATGKLYRWNDTDNVFNSAPTLDVGTYVTGVPAADIDGVLTATNFATSLRPPEVVSSLPSSGNYQGRMVFLTTDNKLYRWTHATTTTGTLSWTVAVPSSDITGTFTSDKITANWLTAGAISAGAISAEQIAAGAITAAKLLIYNPDSFTLDSSFATGSTSWSTGTGITYLTNADTVVKNNLQATHAVKIDTHTSNRHIYARGDANSSAIEFPVRPGEKYEVSARCFTNNANGNAIVALHFTTNTGTTSWQSGTIATPAQGNVTGGFKNSVILTAPANSVTAKVSPYAGANASPAGSWYITDVTVRRQVPGVLIQDGSIHADKIISSSLIADKIASGTLTAGVTLSGLFVTPDIAANPRVYMSAGDTPFRIRGSGTVGNETSRPLLFAVSKDTTNTAIVTMNGVLSNTDSNFMSSDAVLHLRTRLGLDVTQTVTAGGSRHRPTAGFVSGTAYFLTSGTNWTVSTAKTVKWKCRITDSNYYQGSAGTTFTAPSYTIAFRRTSGGANITSTTVTGTASNEDLSGDGPAFWIREFSIDRTFEFTETGVAGTVTNSNYNVVVTRTGGSFNAPVMETFEVSQDLTIESSGGGVSALGELIDVTLTSPVNTHHLRHNGTNWVNAAIPVGDLPTITVAKGGTGLTSPGTSGNVLTSNGTAWVSSAPTGGSSQFTQQSETLIDLGAITTLKAPVNNSVVTDGTVGVGFIASGSYWPTINVHAYGTPNHGGGIACYKSRGTRTAPTNISAGDNLGYFYWSGYSTSWQSGAVLQYVVTTATTGLPGYVELYFGTNYAKTVRFYSEGTISTDAGYILQNSSVTLGRTHVNAIIHHSNTTAYVYTLPSGDTSFRIGDSFQVHTESTGTTTIRGSTNSQTMKWFKGDGTAPVSGTTDRICGRGSIVTVTKVGTAIWHIYGAGIT
jgi:hypothetical protein